MISIAMTTYNGEKYLREQLDSILNQTFSDFELIICDDCSKDATVKILEEYSLKDKRVRYFVNEKNLGFKKNFEKAISLCSGEYVAFSDQDDIWLPEKLEESITHIGNNNLLCSNSLLIDENGNSLNLTYKECAGLNRYFPNDYEFRFKHILIWNFVQGASVLAKKDFLLQNMPIPENLVYHDYYFGVIAQMQNSLIYYDKVLAKYRQHTTQQTENKKASFNIFKRYQRKDYDDINNAKNILTRNDFPFQFKSYVEDYIKYNEYMNNNKNFFTLSFYSKNYIYFTLDKKKSHKVIHICKRIISIILFKIKRLFTK